VLLLEFRINHPVLFVLAGIVVAVVLAQSVYFLVKALRRSKELGLDQEKIKKTIKTAAIFTIAPAVAIVISVLALSKSLGLALPWLRLSVVGSMSYETIAASNALQAMGKALGVGELNAQDFANVLIIMTISIMAGLLLVPIIGKKLQTGMANLGKRDAAWAEIFQNALFIGMIAAFLGYVFSEIYMLWTPNARFITETVIENGMQVEKQVAVPATYGLIPVCVMLVSAVTMVICGIAMRHPKLKWLSEYALPISLVVGMAAAIPITGWLG
jgi:heme/copper-type cytochrome/quinol oxidase subunit 2